MRVPSMSAGGPSYEEWETWHDGSGINMIDVKVEGLWTAGMEGSEDLITKICVEAGIPVNELVSFDKLFSQSE